MREEIGGYFEFESLKGKEFHNDCLRFNSARNSLLFVLKKRNVRTIYMPYYLCDSVFKQCKLSDINVKFYKIDENFQPIINEPIKGNEFVFVVNYYGLLSNELLQTIKEKYLNIIVDNTHAFFRKALEGVDTIYNCRKYFGVPDGAYLSTNLDDDLDVPTGKSKFRFEHLLGRLEESASQFYEKFKEADRSFTGENIEHMSLITQNILKAIDYDYIIKQRKKNIMYLIKNLNKYNKIKVDDTMDFMYPFYCDNSDLLRKKLIENKVYVPYLWPNVLSSNPTDSYEYKYVNNIVPLPIDQRYNINDMKLIVDIIKGGIYEK